MNTTDEIIARVRTGDQIAANELATYIESLEADLAEIRDILNLTPDKDVVAAVREKMTLYEIMMETTRIQREADKRNRWAGNPLFRK